MMTGKTAFVRLRTNPDKSSVQEPAFEELAAKIKEDLEAAKDKEGIREKADQWRAVFPQLQGLIEHLEELERDWRGLFNS